MTPQTPGNRTAILMGRLHKLENLQAKLVNLKDGIVFGGELPDEAKAYFKSPIFKEKADAKIKKAEYIKWKIAIAICDDLQNPNNI